MQDDAPKARTDAKLRYARIHIDALRTQPVSRGHDFERAHQEASLAQLFGAYAALLQELNIYLGCNLAPDDVTIGKMRKALKNKGKDSPLLSELYDLEKDQSSWFRYAKDMRDHSTHVSGIPLSHYVGGPQDGVTALRNPKTLVEIPGDATDTLSSYLLEMERLVQRFRDAGEITRKVGSKTT
jgi:hypothetical protein